MKSGLSWIYKIFYNCVIIKVDIENYMYLKLTKATNKRDIKQALRKWDYGLSAQNNTTMYVIII